MEEALDSTEFSIKLSRVLNAIGVNDASITNERETYIFYEQFDRVFTSLRENYCTKYIFGSRIEGSTTRGLISDEDRLYEDHLHAVLQDLTFLEDDKINVFLLLEDTAPGYCRLQLLQDDVSLDSKHLAYDGQMRVLLKNSIFDDTGIKKHGPAHIIKGPNGEGDNDSVLAYRCKTWLKGAGEWVTRKRHYNWPPPHIIKETINHGFFVVPVGYKLSEASDLEWRISFSLTERDLMFSLNVIHIRVYVVMKMLVKTYIKPHVGDNITSYHCKTALFYCIEKTDPKLWKDNNILNCIQACLSYLFRWVKGRHCPHYILPRANLFAGKVTAVNKEAILSILQSMLNNIFQHLTGVTIDNLGQLLERFSVFNIFMTGVSYSKGQKCSAIMRKAHYIIQRVVMYMVGRFMRFYTNRNVSFTGMIINDIQMIYACKQSSTQYMDRLINIALYHLYPLCGSIFASDTLSKEERIPRNVMSLLQSSKELDQQLKLASIMYCINKLQKTKELLNALKPIINSALSFCHCYYSDVQKNTLNQLTVHYTFSEDTFENRLVTCVKFCVHEIYCIPPGMQYELYKAVGKDAQNRDTDEDKWMSLAVIDCTPFFFYLQYLTQCKLGDVNMKKKALKDFEHYVKAGHILGHHETAWNLLGQCMEQEQKPAAALNCYRKSLKIRPRNNAANLLLSILLFKLVY